MDAIWRLFPSIWRLAFDGCHLASFFLHLEAYAKMSAFPSIVGQLSGGDLFLIERIIGTPPQVLPNFEL